MRRIAIVPARGGSKGIKDKNIKLFCGKPLIYWTLKELNNCKIIDEIVLATDSLKISNVVEKFDFNKVQIYDRKAENAKDDSSTESVILEYLQYRKLDKSDIIILAQATSPLTLSSDYENCFSLFDKNKFDSILSCVNQKRFYWGADGKPLNYDYLNRPRRQDFEGNYVENGAIYINSVGRILKNKNRLSGKIGLYQMSNYSYYEIDDDNDWFIMESLMKEYIMNKKSNYKDIKLFISDVDGVLTDSGMYYSENGDELKKFNTKDGMAFQLLREKGIKTALITSEETQIVTQRAKKMKIDFIHQGMRDECKLESAKQICKKLDISLDQIIYVGDDLNCFELLSNVGIAACPSDASEKIKSIPGIMILSKKGGEGVVRELVDRFFN